MLHETDPIKKTVMEKRIVLVLGVVLVFSVAVGPMRQVGIWRMQPRKLMPAMSALSNVQQALPSPLALQDPTQTLANPPASQRNAPSFSSVGTSPEVAAQAYTAQALRDPLQSLLPADPPKSSTPVVASTSAPPPPQLRLQGVLWGGPKPTAIINDKVYTVGDHVQGATVTAIDRREVTLDFRGTPLSLRTAKSR